jgi:hypothetical protein
MNFAKLHHDERIADIAHDRQTAKAGDDLAQKFKPLAGNIGRHG